jgi:spore coat polysaccharide biosynthesis protein SpsF (cytidylyltransferase family)
MTNETKQTAVDWLLDRIEDVDLTEKLWENVKQQAKEMEKDQRMSDFIMGITNANRMEATKDAEQWYNETYGGNK